jgi:hypothetical protein
MELFDGKHFWVNLHDIILFAVYTSVFLTVMFTPPIIVTLILYRIFIVG